MDFLSKEVNVSEVKVQVSGPSGPVKVDLDLGPRGGKGVFVPTQVGFYEVRESTKFLNFTIIMIMIDLIEDQYLHDSLTHC